ncbi:uncharacterized protein P174DRAFT_422399 [Aspergillus novofumigatus IBT 16806]|uniref:Uncharacterized protein n=1 Tax=Aspergillus novofumigatus (strain IBT 16806) TaxID=1392255 RepID=A0A2I1C728_ASPN1|nr:uncharacterized protein P174DRAFT_422399 [Aspergillus novofumigatus IBT 16806]PKX93396.1 hypothetical protein P174DRAFT_422399 [Aspergillus novofumigatus IBT 16806]
MPFKQHSGRIYRITRLLVFHLVFILTACPRQSSAAADVFIFPPQNGYTGEYISNLAFTVGQSIDIKWKSGCDQSIQFWLMKDFNGGDCQFQRDALCSQIADTPNNGSIAWNVTFMGLAGPGVYYIYGLCSDPGSTRFSCHYFNVTSKQVSSSTTAPKTTASIPASTTQSSLLDSITPTSTSTSTAPALVVETPKSTTPVGAIVGGVIGGLLIIGLTLIVGTILLRKRASSHPGGRMRETWAGKAELPEATHLEDHELPCPDSIPEAMNHDYGQQSSGSQRPAPIELPS